MTLDDWILALHVLSAFALVAALVLFSVLVFAIRRTDRPDLTARMEPIVKVGNVIVSIGLVGTIVFGIWLALSYGNYDLWDGWIIAALVLWAIAAETGRRSGVAYARALDKAQELEAAGETGPSTELAALNRTPNGFLMHTFSSLATLLVLLDMIWKPGA